MKTRVMIIGKHWGEAEQKLGLPFAGATGGLLNSFLSSAGVAKQDCYFTNVFNFRPPGGNFSNILVGREARIEGWGPVARAKYVPGKYAFELSRLRKEIELCEPNIIIALGPIATWALCNDIAIKKLRGSPIHSTRLVPGIKVFPTYHPSTIFAQYNLRPIVFNDFKKAAREMQFPEIRRPKRAMWLHPTLYDIKQFDPLIRRAKYLSVDIETWQGQITCIGFAPDETRAIVIPFVWHGHPSGNYWPTLEEELKVWDIVAEWLDLPQPKIGQNFLYDISYLWAKYGIPVRNAIRDTMLTHHAQQPEMEKSLGFLGSIYTSEPSWKFMRKDIKTLKTED